MGSSYEFSKTQEETVFALGELILGYSQEDLGDEFIQEAENFIDNLDDFLISDLDRLLKLFNSRLLSFILLFKLTPFNRMDMETKKKYFKKWVYSRIGLLRTGASTIRALCGWSYYSLEKSWDDLNYPGKTLGREDKTPTLLNGKEPWTEGMEVE